MLADVKWLREKYNFFNNLLWNGELPSIAFKINHSKIKWGYATYQFNLWNNTAWAVSITISNEYDSPENIKLGVLIHEMIHIADYTFHPEHFVRNGKKVSKRIYNAHGSVYFLPQMDRINKELKEQGFDIIVYPSVQDSEVAASVLSPKAQARLDKRVADGVRVFITDLRYPDKNGKHTYAICQQSSYNRWLNEIENDDWWRTEYQKTDEYITQDPNYIMKKTTRVGLSYYIKNDDVEGFIKNHSLQFVKNLYIDERRYPKQEEKPAEIEEPKPVEIIKPKSNLIPLFRLNTMQGNTFEVKNATREEIKRQLSERFPKWSDEVLEKVLNNEKYYPMGMNEVFTKEDIATMVNEAMEQILGGENVKETPSMRRSKVKQIDQYTFEESIE